METFLKYVGEEEVKLHYHRREVYAKNPKSENPRFVSLESLGWIFYLAKVPWQVV